MSKILLNESFLKHLVEKPLYRITVTEICEDADINRSTYYAHFTDPYDQLKKIETELIADMSARVDHLMEDGVYDKKRQYQTIKHILEFILERKKVFRVLCGRSEDLNFIRDIQVFFARRIFENEDPEKLSSSKEAYHYIYISTGSFGIIYYWIMNETSVDIDTIADWVTEFSMASIPVQP